MEILGTKYQTYIDDELIILRLINIKSEDKFTMIDKDGNRVSMTKEELNKCVKLEADALLCIMSATLDDGVRDVYACVNRIEDMRKGVKEPTLILRQNIYSSSKNAFGNGFDIYVGECLANPKLDNDNQFKSLLEFNTIDDTLSVALYVDDKFKDIKQFITGHNARKFDEVLRVIKSSNTNSMIKGYCDTLEELFSENNFMFNYRLLFNIAQIDFRIELDNNTDKDGVITLNNKQIKRLEEDVIRQYITDVRVLKYDKDIDISKIVDKTHVMISDETENIYLVSYVLTGSFPVDDDIARAMNYKNTTE